MHLRSLESPPRGEYIYTESYHQKELTIFLSVQRLGLLTKLWYVLVMTNRCCGSKNDRILRLCKISPSPSSTIAFSFFSFSNMTISLSHTSSPLCIVTLLLSCWSCFSFPRTFKRPFEYCHSISASASITLYRSEPLMLKIAFAYHFGLSELFTVTVRACW